MGYPSGLSDLYCAMGLTTKRSSFLVYGLNSGSLINLLFPR